MWNVIADNWTNGKYCLMCHVETKTEAERHARVYRDRYENKPYPNGKGFYPYKNFRAVRIEETPTVKHTTDDTPDINWCKLAEVIKHAESLGPGYTVFRFNSEGDRYGITESTNIPANVMFTGRYLGAMGIGLFVRAEKVFVMYRTKRRVIYSD